MTATLTRTPAEEIAWARKVYDTGERANWSGGQVAYLLTELWGAIDLSEALDADLIHPASEWDDLAVEDEAKHVALERAARDAGEWAREVLDALPGIAQDINGGTEK